MAQEITEQQEVPLAQFNNQMRFRAVVEEEESH